MSKDTAIGPQAPAPGSVEPSRGVYWIGDEPPEEHKQKPIASGRRSDGTAGGRQG